MNDEVVTRLYRCLVEELRRRGHSEEQPVKVSDLYQELVPYRAVRSALGVELNADYEHAMLRLLAGERDLLRLHPEEARDELRREVEAPYPFVGMFRKFAASDVWVSMAPPAANGDAPDDAGERGQSAPRAGRGGDTRPDARRPEPGRAGGGAAAAAPARISAEPGAPGQRRGSPIPARGGAPVHLVRHPPGEAPERVTATGENCVFCSEALPPGRRIRFCPHCGGDQRLRPCPRCDAVLERDWRYCISCGHEVSGR